MRILILSQFFWKIWPCDYARNFFENMMFWLSNSYISSLREGREYLREENRAKTLIIKQLTEIKAAINPTNTLVTYNENSVNKTTQNSGNVIDKTIKNNNKEPFKNKKNINKNLANTKTLSTFDNFTGTCFEHPKNEKD